MSDSLRADDALARVGRTLKAKWRLDRLIGLGGTAAVYAATHRNGARVAIKILHPELSASPTLRQRFLREGYLANKVDHPGVVRVLDDDIDGQCVFLVMDLVSGCTLGERAMDRLLDAGELLEVAEQVLEVLTAAHAQGVVHRDLKPDNILIDGQGKVHVLDFGLARLHEHGAWAATKTVAGAGTPGFMAPEQARGRADEITARTDLYALGATLVALATGQFVHDAENERELAVLVATRRGRSLGELEPSMPRVVVELVDKATQMSPDDRWESAPGMLAAVREARRSLGVESTRLFAAPASEPHPADGAGTLSAQMKSLAPPAARAIQTPFIAPEGPFLTVPAAPASPRSWRGALAAAVMIAAAVLVFASTRTPSPSVAPSSNPRVLADPPSAPPSVSVASSSSAAASASVLPTASTSAPPAKPPKRPPRPKPIDLGY